jgi:arylsulfatase A
MHPSSLRLSPNRRRFSICIGAALTVLFLGPILLMAAPVPAAPPNVVLILADDMGYGDPRCFNPESKIETPNIDRLAKEGMRFTDAHAAGAVCIPSRYGLLTGRFPFRNAGNHNPSRGPLIDPGRPTIATVLQGRGYATAMVGKWHLGFEGGVNFDCDKPLRGGPADHGFQYFFGQHASLDIPPYFFIENDRCVEGPTESVAASSTPGWSPIQGAFWRAGKKAPGLRFEEVLPTYTRKAVDYIEQRGQPGQAQPFFLYVALPAPHTPWLPAPRFQNRSRAGLYGDFVMQVDETVGKILEALDRKGLTDRTLVIFTSDNGPTWYPKDVKRFGHASAAGFRGMKGDGWEGGHREPFIVRWPGQVQAGSRCDETISFTDLLATFAAAAGSAPPAGSAEDSVSLLPLFRGEKHASPYRKCTVFESSRGLLSVREGDWKYIPGLGSGGFTRPAIVPSKPGEPAGQLYNLAQDPAESTNLYAQEPEKVKRLVDLLEQFKNGLPTRSSKLR